MLCWPQVLGPHRISSSACSTTVFSNAQTVVLCGSCSSVLCQPTGTALTCNHATALHAAARSSALFHYHVHSSVI